MSKQPKILFVEDSGFFRKAVAQSLSKEGFDVSTASTGEEALKAAQSEPPALILLDMMLPKLDGMMVLRILRASTVTRSIPVIVLSGNPWTGIRRKRRNWGLRITSAKTRPR